MATKKAAEQQQAEQALDEFHGQGGSYIVDPATGKRTLAHRTDHPDTVARASAGAAATTKE